MGAGPADADGVVAGSITVTLAAGAAPTCVLSSSPTRSRNLATTRSLITRAWSGVSAETSTVMMTVAGANVAVVRDASSAAVVSSESSVMTSFMTRSLVTRST
ncbi:hypothetical protein RhoFasK5_03319|nr:hypothetical protein [Rhodococcus kroppenstedtii]